MLKRILNIITPAHQIKEKKPNSGNELIDLLSEDYGNNSLYVFYLKKIIEILETKFNDSHIGKQYIKLAISFLKELKKQDIDIEKLKSKFIELSNLFFILDKHDLKKYLLSDINKMLEPNSKASIIEKDIATYFGQIIEKREIYYKTHKKTRETKKIFWNKNRDIKLKEVLQNYLGFLKYKQFTIQEFSDYHKDNHSSISSNANINYDNFIGISVHKIGVQLFGMAYSGDGQYYTIFGNSEGVQLMLIFSKEFKIEARYKLTVDYSDTAYKKKHIYFDKKNGIIVMQYKNKIYKINYEYNQRRSSVNYGQETMFLDVAHGLPLLLKVDLFGISLYNLLNCKLENTIDNDGKSLTVKEKLDKLIEFDFCDGIKHAEFSDKGDYISITSNLTPIEINGKKYYISKFCILDAHKFQENLDSLEDSDKYNDKNKSKLKIEPIIHKGYPGEIFYDCFSINDLYYAIAGSKGLRIFDLNDKDCLIENKKNVYYNDKKTTFVTFSPNGKYSLVGIQDGVLGVINLETNSTNEIDLAKELIKRRIRSQKDLPDKRTIENIVFSPNGKEVLIGFSDNEIIRLEFA